MRVKKLLLAPAVITAVLVSTPARAYPQLQLDIVGGHYDNATETIMAGNQSLSPYAYSQSLPGNFFLSMALVPPTGTAGNYGSYSVNGSTINVTSGMTYGVPPLETLLGGATKDPGDLSQHSIFPTYFAERMFTFSAGSQSGLYNTAEQAGSGPQAGTGMYYARFDFDISGLSAGLGLHFDLYNETLVSQCGKKAGGSCTVGDIDVNLFAPFSHDAQAMVTPVPEPQTYAMLLAGLGLLGFEARRRRKLQPATA